MRKKAPEYLIPVSYTHLDVYKRQKEGFLNGITGTYKPPSGYFTNEEEAEKFDAQFPPKEKRKLSGQLF